MNRDQAKNTFAPKILRVDRPGTGSIQGRPSSGSPVHGPRVVVKTRPTQAADDQTPVSTDPTNRTMREAERFVSDAGEIIETILDVMSTSPNFNVISAIGPQGSGKSTLLSMLAGNNSHQMYREYFFRPVSREANEQSRHQTVQVDIFVTNHQIFLDCQPMHSLSIMDGLPKVRGAKLDDLTALSDTLRLTAFLLYVSHTVLVVSETNFDKTLIDTIRVAEHIRPYLPQFRPKLSIDRKTHLVFIKSKASSIDLSRSVIREREELLRFAFRDSKWLKVSDEPMKVLIPLEEIRIKREHLHDVEHEQQADPDEKLNEFDEAVSRLRDELQKNREEFTVEVAAMDEKKWLEMCREVIRDKSLHKTLKLFQTAYTNVLKKNPDPMSFMSSFSR